MALSAGKLRHRVTLERRCTDQDSVSGDISDAWIPVANLWAAIEPLSAREFIEASALQSKVTARITIRFRPGVKAAMRLVHKGRLGRMVYNIEGVLSDKESGLEYLTLPCSEGVNEG